MSSKFSFLIIIIMSGIYGDAENYKVDKEHFRDAKAPIFPSEEPTENELRLWVRAWETLFREKNLLQFISASPAKTAEFTAKALIRAPRDASDAIKASIFLKNHETSVLNDERDVMWHEHVRAKNDVVVALLSAALWPKAEMRLKALLAKHVYPSPYEDQVDGGAMFRDLKNLLNTLDSEEQEDTCFAAYVYMRDNPALPSNATAQQFADRCN